MNNKNKTFLVCHRGALGDFILTWPAVLLLRKHFPEHKFFGLGRPEYMRLAVKLGILEEYRDADSAIMRDFFDNGMIPSIIGKPDRGVLWLKDAKETAELLARNSGCDFAPMAPFPDEKLHVAKFHCREIFKYYNFNGTVNILDLTPEHSFPRKNIILIHPGSGSSKKNYPPEFYLEVAKSAEMRFKREVKFILGPVETEKGFDKFFAPDKTILPENASALADVLGGAYLYIGNDSGASHLSGILGVPTVVLYKSTDPEIWGAVGKKVKCIEDADESAVLEKLRNFFISGNIFDLSVSN